MFSSHIHGNVSIIAHTYTYLHSRLVLVDFWKSDRVKRAAPAASHRRETRGLSLCTFHSSRDLFFSRIAARNRVKTNRTVIHPPIGRDGARQLGHRERCQKGVVTTFDRANFRGYRFGIRDKNRARFLGPFAKCFRHFVSQTKLKFQNVFLIARSTARLVVKHKRKTLIADDIIIIDNDIMFIFIGACIQARIRRLQTRALIIMRYVLIPFTDTNLLFAAIINQFLINIARESTRFFCEGSQWTCGF